MVNKIKSILLKYRKHISSRQVAYLGLLTFVVKNPWTILSTVAAAWTGYKLFTTGTYIQSWFSFSAWKDWIWNNSRPTIFDSSEVTSAARQAAQQAVDSAAGVYEAASESAQQVLDRVDEILVEPEETFRDLDEERRNALSRGESEYSVYLLQINEVLGKFESLENLPENKDVPQEVFNLLNELSSKKCMTIESMVKELVQDKEYLEAASTEEEKLHRYEEIMAAHIKANTEVEAEIKTNAKYTLIWGTSFGISALIIGKILSHYSKI